jgi:ribosomal protein S12 methylthiotransferase accessory factor
MLSRSIDKSCQRNRLVTQPPTTLERLMCLVSRRTGVVKNLVPVPKAAIDPTPPYIYQAVLADSSYGRETGPVLAGVGKGEGSGEAKVRALAEAVERYCATQPDPRRSLRACLAGLGGSAVDPTDCVLYSDRQYALPGFHYARFSQQTTMTWTYGTVLPGNEIVAVPAILVYLNRTWEQQEEYICSPTSNGLAAGVDVGMAILHGLLEVVERDAFMISWLTRRRCSRVDYSRQRGLLATIRNHYSRFGIELVVIDLTTDLPIHVMMAIAIDHGEVGPAAVVGLGANLNPAVAVEKAFNEVCQGRSGEAPRYRQKPPQERLRRFEDVRDMMDHSALFSMPQMLCELEFLVASESGNEVRLEELPNYSTGCIEGDARLCVDALADVGSRVIYVDITTPDIASIGLRVVRTIVTGLQPIHFGHGQERLGGTRVFELPMKLGYARGPLTEGDINPCPHPLA